MSRAISAGEDSMNRDAGQRSRASLVIVSFVLITAAACSGISLPGQSSGTGSGPGASVAISIGSAKDLEALLPDTLCGQPAEKGSASGSAGLPGASGSPDPFGGIVGALGGAGSLGAALVQ